MNAYLWKEWKEMSRGKALWGALVIVVLLSFLLLAQSRTLPSERGLEVFLLSLYEMNVYVIPLFGLFTASFALLQEKEQKTLHILLTKKESYSGFLLRKSAAVQTVTTLLYVLWFCLFAVPMKASFAFHFSGLLHFLLAIVCMLLLFNQIGVLLGSVCTTKMQLAGLNLLVWFAFVFLIDLAFLYVLPSVTDSNAALFSFVYFLDPLHTLHLYLEHSLGFYPLGHLSRLMNEIVWLPPRLFLLADMILWPAAAFGLAVLLGRKGDQHD